jgi:pimeloyl-ACP methyl ester carboxylesterase
VLPRTFHSTRAGALALAVLLPAAAWAQQPAAPSLPDTSASTFSVFIRGAKVGSEQVAIARSADGWTITTSGRLGPPIDLVHRQLQVRYDSDWKPLGLDVDAVLRGQGLALHTVVRGTTATTEFTEAGKSGQKVDEIAADALLLPSPFWGPFEALSIRSKNISAGTVVPAYVSQMPVGIRIGEPTSERIETASRTIDVRRVPLRIMTASAPLDAELWSDEAGRMMRLTIPAQGIDVLREDIAAVSARRVPISRPNDESIRIPSNGFSLSGTLSKPEKPAAARLPAVILVGGSGPTDRDEMAFGIPVLGQIAGPIADAGFIVIRYDKRGVGQSGGRLESAGLNDYTDDVQAAIKFLTSRKDVDAKRIFIAGHSEGGNVAMMAADRDKRIAGIVLIAAPGVSGADLVLQQQAHLLDRTQASPAEREEKIALQRKIHDAVTTGQGWDELPAAVRRQVDNPEFQSILLSDPAKLVPNLRQPILIVQGELDTQVSPSNADRLAELAHQRKGKAAVQVVKVPGVNHLLVPATTGEVDEYSTLPDKTVSPAVIGAITSWLQTTAGASTR